MLRPVLLASDMRPTLPTLAANGYCEILQFEEPTLAEIPDALAL